MKALLELVRRQLKLWPYELEVIAVSTTNVGTAIICFDAEMRAMSRIILSDSELANRLADIGPGSAGIAWDLMSMLKDGGSKVEPSMCESLNRMLALCRTTASS